MGYSHCLILINQLFIVFIAKCSFIFNFDFQFEIINASKVTVITHNTSKYNCGDAYGDAAVLKVEILTKSLAMILKLGKLIE